MASGRKCHEGPCGPCYLCGMSTSKYTHPVRFTTDQYALLCKVENEEIDKSVCICYACNMQIQRNQQSTTFKPRWKKNTTKTEYLCGIENCGSLVKKRTQLASKNDIERILGGQVMTFTVTEDKVSVPLCQAHYNHLYTHLTTSAPCDFCAGKPRKNEHFNRHCPDPEAINEYFMSAENSVSLTNESIICTACYKYLKLLEKKIKCGIDGKPLNRAQRNAEIDSLLAVIHSKQVIIYDKRATAKIGEYLEYIVCKLCTYMGERMKADEAMLLPKLYKLFTNEFLAQKQHFPNISVSDSDIPTKRWLTSHIHAHFENEIEVQCIHRCYGTLIYHKSCDLVHALSSALGKSETGISDTASTFTSDVSVEQPTLQEQMNTVALYINQKLHERANAQKETFSDPRSISTLNLSAALNTVNPDLLHFLRTMTQPIRCSRRKLFDCTTSAEYNSHTKNVRLFYALSMLVFCTYPQCSVPMHVLVTEAVLCHGGTLELVAILNRLGAAASLDTVNRLATCVVTRRMSDGVLSDLATQKFAAVSIDNIDILQPYGFVSCTDATRSWHGTSVQCVQPLPLSGNLTDDNVLPPVQGVHTNKRTCNSPVNTPVAREKYKRRRRTLAERSSPHTELVAITSQSNPFQTTRVGQYERRIGPLTLDHFKPNESEQSALESLRHDLFHSIVLRKCGSSLPTQPFPGLQSIVNCMRKQAYDKEVSKVTYVEIISEKADCKATLIRVIGRLQNIFVEQYRQKYVLVVGDAKTYNLIQSIRYEYQSCLKWLIPFPGDWHILYNYQKALMKPYADAGLAALAKVTGHRAETLTSLLQASNFRRTHEFLLQCLDAFYQYFISLYTEHMSGLQDCTQSIEKQIDEIVSSLIDQFNTISSDEDLDSFRDRCSDIMSSDLMPIKYTNLTRFMDSLAEKYETVHFWYQFVFVDCFAYFSLFIAIRYRNWELRNGSLKLLAGIFAAFDRPIYQELIPRHLKDVLTMPSSVLHHLRKGSFSVRLSPSEWHGVALDECHEMSINKDAKLAVIHPSKNKMEFLSNYLGYRSACMHNLKEQLFPERSERKSVFHAPSSQDRKRDENIEKMINEIGKKNMQVSALWNFFEGKKATPEQEHDLLNFRQIGQESFDNYVSTRIIGLPSTNAPNRRKRLVTFSVTRVQKQRVKLVERERRLSERYLKKQLAWISEKGTEHVNVGDLLGPISPLPRALIGEDSLPYKSNKSNATQYLRKRYSELCIVIEHPPHQWVPHVAILEGMFMIQTLPLPTMSCMKEYVQLLIMQCVRPHFRAGAEEVHVVFDSPGSMPETPKELEQKRRDNSAEKTSSSHDCTEINSTTVIPTNWRALLGCRKCKKNLTKYVAEEMLSLIPTILNGNQTLTCNIGEVAQSVTSTTETLPRPMLWSNADEADMRVWLHCMHSTGTRKLIFSPDTDVYHVGLAFAPLLQGMEVVVQLTKTFREGSKFLLLHKLLQALASDPDLHGIPLAMRSQALQSLYVCTGCDYISFFRGMGKVSFMKTFFQYASFIAGGSEAPGSIGDLAHEDAYMSFLRLVGATYFRAHASAFELPSPVTLYHSMSANCPERKHEQWLHHIRRAIWIRADSESKNMPSITALKLHWTRCLWVVNMWQKAIENDIDMPGN